MSWFLGGVFEAFEGEVSYKNWNFDKSENYFHIKSLDRHCPVTILSNSFETSR